MKVLHSICQQIWKTQQWQLDWKTSVFIPMPKNVETTTKLDSCQLSSVTQLCPTLCDPRDCIIPGLPVHHQLTEPIQTHVNHISNTIQPSHPLSSHSPPAFNLSQHQDLFQWFFTSGCQSIGVSALAAVLPINIQD